MSLPTVNCQHIYNYILEDSLKDSLNMPSRFCVLDDNNKRLVESLIEYSYNSFCDFFLRHEQVHDLEYLSKEITDTLSGLLGNIKDLRRSLQDVV